MRIYLAGQDSPFSITNIESLSEEDISVGEKAEIIATVMTGMVLHPKRQDATNLEFNFNNDKEKQLKAKKIWTKRWMQLDSTGEYIPIDLGNYSNWKLHGL